MPKIRVTAARKNPRKPFVTSKQYMDALRGNKKQQRRVRKASRVKRHTRVTRVRKNTVSRASQKFVVEALQRRGDRKFKFWYWDGTRLTTDRGAAMQFANAALAKPVARRVLQGVPSSVLYVRVVKA